MWWLRLLARNPPTLKKTSLSQDFTFIRPDTCVRGGYSVMADYRFTRPLNRSLTMNIHVFFLFFFFIIIFTLFFITVFPCILLGDWNEVTDSCIQPYGTISTGT